MAQVAVLGDSCIGSGFGNIIQTQQLTFVISGIPVASVGDTVLFWGIFPLIGPFSGDIKTGNPSFLVGGKSVATNNSVWVAGPYSGTIGIVMTSVKGIQTSF